MGLKNIDIYEDDNGNEFPIPFAPEFSEPEFIFVSEDGKRAVLAFLDRDQDASDPFEEFEEGEFVQFDRNRAHDASRPELGDWKHIIRSNPARIVSVDACGYSFSAGKLLTPADCRRPRHGKEEDCEAARVLGDMDGYYIVPEDATNPAEYAEGSLETYSAWCEGDVFGVCVWTYERGNDTDAWPDPERGECWGFYGEDYAREELRGIFEEATK